MGSSVVGRWRGRMPRPATRGRSAGISARTPSSTRRWVNSRSPMPTRRSATTQRCALQSAPASWRCSWSTEPPNGEDLTGREPMRSTPVLEGHETAALEVEAAKAGASAGFAHRAGAFFLHEFLEMLPPTIFFFVGFNLIVLTTNLILADYSVAFASFMLAAAAALVVGKSVLVANAMAVLRRYDRAPLIQPILFKTVFYWAIVFVARLLEHFIRFWLIENNPPGDFLSHMMATFSWHRFAAIQIWILVLFLIYVTASELNHLVGDGELRRILFPHRRSELQQNRRQRIRELVRLSRLADAHSLDEFRDPTSAAHRQLVEIVQRLARWNRTAHLDQMNKRVAAGLAHGRPPIAPTNASNSEISLIVE